MTVIAAIPSPDGVFMAADSRVVRNDTVVCDTDKIIVKQVADDEILIATSGHYTLSALARHALNLPLLPDPGDPQDCDRWAHAVACALAELAVEAKPPLLQDGRVDGDALLAFDRHLWLLNSGAAVRIAVPFAIGSGAPEARGALHVAMRHVLGNPEPAWQLAVAIQAAIDLDPNCGGPAVIARTTVATIQDR